MKVLDSRTVQEWEARSIEQATSVAALMEEAIDGLTRWIKHRFPPGRCLALCGKGNNGNDTLWLADRLRELGWHVEICLSHPPEDRSAPEVAPIRRAQESARIWPDFPGDTFSSGPPVLVIDGLLGLGARGAPRSPYDEMIQRVMHKRRSCDRIISIDFPSGVDTDSGSCHDPHVQADFTVAIGAVKSGCLQRAASDAVGRLSAIPISLVAPAPEADSEFFTLGDATLHFPRRFSGTYKNRQGTVSIWAGSAGMAGAAILCSRAALHSGAGLVRLFVPETILPHVMTATPEVMVHPVLTPGGQFNPLLFEAEALLAGPGLGTDESVRSLFSRFSAAVSQPLVLDADALNLCGPGKQELASLPARTVLTPHPGEFARFFPAASGDRIADARQFTSLNPNRTLVLKGPQTIVAQSSHPLSFNGSGNPGLATAGSGDVLAGLTAGLLAGGRDPRDAARLAVFWHGHAADHAVRLHGETSLTAGTVIDFLGAASLDFHRP
jgi:hydroxyethylthiazole kinase-like uncharacterized protein yjeF